MYILHMYASGPGTLRVKRRPEEEAHTPAVDIGGAPPRIPHKGDPLYREIHYKGKSLIKGNPS